MKHEMVHIEAMIKEASLIQQKLLKGLENLLQIKDLESGVTPSEEIFKEDKVTLHYYAAEKKKCSLPLNSMSLAMTFC